MSKYKVIVYAISKNEEKFVDRWAKSMAEADGIYVCDTGSDDNTVTALREHNINVKEIKVEPWRFDTARNISLDFVPDDTDICVCTDLDEVFKPGWRKELEKYWTSDTTRAKYEYTWSFDKNGNPSTVFLTEKIHSRKNFKWIHPVHEILECSGDRDKYVYLPEVKLYHYPDKTKSRGQYLKLLEQSVEESPDDDRNMHYLGREYMFYGQWDKCINTLKRHIEMPSSQWNDERCASMRYIARAYKAKGNYYESDIWYLRAIAEAPYLREPYVEAAQNAYEESKWEKVYYLLTEALKITTRPLTYINEEYCWGSLPYDLLSIAAYNLGLYEKALAYSKKASELSPDDNRIKENIKIIEQAKISLAHSNSIIPQNS